MSIEHSAQSSTIPVNASSSSHLIGDLVKDDPNIDDVDCKIDSEIKITRYSDASTENCDPSIDHQSAIFIESNNNNEIDGDDKEEPLVGSFQSKLSIQSNMKPEEETSNASIGTEWDLKTFLNENSIQRNDIDVFIMSEAGKPIYCYSGREDITTLMGVCIALINYVIKTQQDNLKKIRTLNGLRINFAIRSPLVIVVVCRRMSCFDEYTLINQIHAQIISTITLKKLTSIYKQASTYDLKRIIHKNDFKTLDILVKTITTPITNTFPTFKNKRFKLSGRIFNNVISFFTSSSMSMPRSTTTTATNTSGSNSSLNSNNPTSQQVIFLHDHKPNVLSRVYVPIAVMNSALREQITTIINQSVSINSDIVFSILFHIEDDEEYIDPTNNNDNIQMVDVFPTSHFSNVEWNHFNNATSSSEDDDELYQSFESSQNQESDSTNNKLPRHRHLQESTTSDERISSTSSIHPQQTPPSTTIRNLKLISVCNHTTKFRISPLDIQLLYALIKASDSLLASTESLWIPLCLSRVDPNRFLHAHVSYLSKKYCLILLDVDHNNFEKCRLVKETINFKLDQIRLTEPMTGLRSNISELNQPHLQYLCHQTPRHCIVWQSSIQNEFSPLNYYLIDRMQRSSLKTLWLRSMKEQCALLGWQTNTFQLYAQFDSFISKHSALETVKLFFKWFKKEEDKLIIKDA